jgi:hypothetical protein
VEFTALQLPFPQKMALATFALGRNKVQNVEFAGIFGFDDERYAQIGVPDGIIPRFYVLEPRRWLHSRRSVAIVGAYSLPDRDLPARSWHDVLASLPFSLHLLAW